MERLPDSWPLARLSITLDELTTQLSKVVMTATMEIIASCRYPDYGLPCVTQLAKDVTIALALHLADLVATGEAPSERRTIYFIFTDPVLGAIEGVTVLRNSDLKQAILAQAALVQV